MDETFQLGSAVVISIVIAIGLIFFFVFMWVVRVVWRWMTGSSSKARDQRQEPKFALAQTSGASGVSASDLFVIRSNLNPVPPQDEHLEPRLRLSSNETTNITGTHAQ